MPRFSFLRTLIVVAIAVCLSSLLIMVRLGRPPTVNLSDLPERVTAGQLQPGRMYDLLVSQPGAPDRQHSTFLIQDPATWRRYSLIQPDLGCDTAVWIRPRTLTVKVESRFDDWGRRVPVFLVLINPVRRNQIINIPNFPGKEFHPAPSPGQIVASLGSTPDRRGSHA